MYCKTRLIDEEVSSSLTRVARLVVFNSFGRYTLDTGAHKAMVLGLNRILMAAVVDVSEFENDQAPHRRAIFRGLEVGVGAQVVGGGPEVVFELFELAAIHRCISEKVC